MWSFFHIKVCGPSPTSRYVVLLPLEKHSRLFSNTTVERETRKQTGETSFFTAEEHAVARLFALFTFDHSSIKIELYLATHNIKSCVTVFPAANLISNTQNYDKKNKKMQALAVRCHVYW
jgi:hypothetical protein